MEAVKIKKARQREKMVVHKMIGVYCKGHKHPRKEGALCAECDSLYEYAAFRVDKCPFMDDKPFCAHCKVQCYKKVKQEKIRQVMRYAGPRMLLYHPVIAMRHLIDTVKQKTSQRSKQ